ncbi:MAG: chloride channel protein [Candidatus Heimdallarchaeaceae archaeon]
MKKKNVLFNIPKPSLRKFKPVFIKYWKYSKKWFPFSILIGFISGILMGLFTSLVVNLQEWLEFIPIYIRFPIIGGLTSLFLYVGFKEVKGAGISYILKHKNTGTSIHSRVIATKFITSCLTLGVNAPAGREGPSVTIGAAVAYTISNKMKMTKDDTTHAITIGAAACTSAVFRTPLGGTVFASEVPYKHDLDETVFLPALLGSAISLLTSNSILTFFNSHPVYLQIETVSTSLTVVNSLLFLLLGVIAGFSGVLFSLLYKFLSGLANRYIKAYLLPFIGMIITAVIVMLFGLVLPEGLSLNGTGFKSINYLLQEGVFVETHLLILLFIGKIIVTSTCVGLGASGGVMGPSLVTGAVLGAFYARLFPGLDYIAFIVVGMSAMHTATTKTPIASMLLVLEMVGFPALIIPIILSNSAAFVISMDFSLYYGQIQSKEVMLRKKIAHTDVLESISVYEAMETTFPVVKSSATLQESFPLLYLHKVSALSVVDDNNELVGIIASSDYSRGLSEKKKYVHDVMTKDVIVVTREDSLGTVLKKLREHNIEGMPVVEDSDSRKIVGYITFNDVASSYNAALVKLHSKQALSEEELDAL